MCFIPTVSFVPQTRLLLTEKISARINRASVKSGRMQGVRFTFNSSEIRRTRRMLVNQKTTALGVCHF